GTPGGLSLGYSATRRPGGSGCAAPRARSPPLPEVHGEREELPKLWAKDTGRPRRRRRRPVVCRVRPAAARGGALPPGGGVDRGGCTARAKELRAAGDRPVRGRRRGFVF